MRLGMARGNGVLRKGPEARSWRIGSCNLDDQQISKSAVDVDQSLILFYQMRLRCHYARQKLHRLFDALSYCVELLRLCLLVLDPAPADYHAFQDLGPMMSNTRPISDDDALYRLYRSLKQSRVCCSKWCSQNASKQGKNMLHVASTIIQSTGARTVP